jgi:hypothetical protein
MSEDLWLLDESLRVRVFYECDDCDFEDDICLSFYESCPDDEKLFKADETNIYLTPEQAKQFAMALINASNRSMGFSEKDTQSHE